LVSAVQGICFTLGIELMLASYIVVAASDCRFAQIEVKRGIMPSAGATIRMTERAGLSNALRYLLTGDEFNAETALRLGFVQEVVAPGIERQRAMEIATLISQQAPLAVSATLANARKAAERRRGSIAKGAGPAAGLGRRGGRRPQFHRETTGQILGALTYGRCSQRCATTERQCDCWRTSLVGPSRHVAARSPTVAFGAKRTLGGRPSQRI
jgi:enoyl-CoA hydratase/carnithine racemase